MKLLTDRHKRAGGNGSVAGLSAPQAVSYNLRYVSVRDEELGSNLNLPARTWQVFSTRLPCVNLALWLLTALVLAGVPGCLASGFKDSWPFYWPQSVADSKKHGDFVSDVTVVPDHFMWEGHNVQVYECWRERADTVHYLMFKVKIDGELDGEYRMFRRDGLLMNFKQDGDRCYEDQHYGAKHYPFGKHETVHFLRLGTNIKEISAIKEIRLRVGSYTTHQTVADAVMSNTILSFDLSYHNTGR